MRTFHRRRFLQLLGIGGPAALLLPSLMAQRARAGGATFPTRVVFFITPHGTVWRNWKMDRPDLPTDRVVEVPLASSADLGTILAPLDGHRDRLLVVEGLARAGYYQDYRQYASGGGDVNGHSLGRAHALTSSPSINGPGLLARGGGESIDQYLGRSIRGESAWSSRVWGFSAAEAYSYVAAGEPATRVESVVDAYHDVTTTYAPPSTGGTTREERILASRGTAVGLARSEYARIAPLLSGDDRRKLERHRDLLTDLQRTLGGATTLACDPSFAASSDREADFRRLTALVLSCDLTRVVTYTARLPNVTDIGGTADADLHERYAHTSGIGEPGYDPMGETVMTEMNRRYARDFSALLDELASVPEGEGTLLDHTTVVWTSELATGTHPHHDLPIVLAGGANGFFRTGRRVRYPQNLTVPFSWSAPYGIGPAHTRLYVTLLRAVGLPDETFGSYTSVTGSDGTPHPLSGTLTELHV